jgi:hypothetical protein
VVSHAVAFLRFCGERQHVRFHEFWGFGKKGRACLTALSRLLPPYAQHKAVALGTQDLIRHVFLPGLHRELNAAPRSTSGAASSFGSGGGAGATTVVACTMTRANATLILGFSADMLTTIRFAAGSTTWVDQGLVGELIEMANNAAAASVGGPSAPACRSAADILLSLCALGVDMETEARGVLDLLQRADLLALAAPRELSKIVAALLRAPRSRSASGGDDDGGADRRPQRRRPHGGKVQQLLRKVQEAQRQQRRNYHHQ